MNYGKNHESYRKYSALKKFFIQSNDFIDMFIIDNDFKREFLEMEEILKSDNQFDKEFRNYLSIEFYDDYFEFNYFIVKRNLNDFDVYERVVKKTWYVSLKNKTIIIDTEDYYMSDDSFIEMENLDQFFINSTTDEYIYEDGIVIKSEFYDISGEEKVKSLKTRKKNFK